MTVIGRAILIGVMVGGAWASTQPQPADAVFPRGSGEVTLGEPVSVGPDGVVIARERGADGKPSRTVTIGWDRVREVTGTLAGESAKYAGIADKAWRARTRMERGDWVAAEPLFEELFGEYRGRSGPTAMAVSSGLLRCRISRGAQTGAIEPWITYVRSSAGPNAGDQVDPETSKLIDPGTGLVGTLPPMWSASSAVQAFARTDVPALDPNSKPTPSEVRANSLLILYVLAAKVECGITATLPSQTGATADPGVRLVYDIVKSRLGDDSQRRDARRSLQERVNSKSPLWVETWCRVAIGRSLMMENDPELKRLGVASLAYAASRTTPSDAYLTGLALADMAVGLSRSGNEAAAARLAAEAADRFPDHPALESPALARWMMNRQTRTTTPAAAPADGQKGDQQP